MFKRLLAGWMVLIWIVGVMPVHVMGAEDSLVSYDYQGVMDLVQSGVGTELTPEDWNDPSRLIQLNANGSNLTYSTLSGYEAGLRVSLSNTGQNAWDPQLLIKLDSGMAQGDTVFFGFKVRMVSPVMSLKTRLRPDGSTSMNFDVTTGEQGQWIQVYTKATVPVDSVEGADRFAFQLGGTAQTVEIADFFLIDFKSDVDVSQLPDWEMSPTIYATPQEASEEATDPNLETYTFEEIRNQWIEGTLDNLIPADWYASSMIGIENGVFDQDLIVSPVDVTGQGFNGDQGLRLETPATGPNNWSPQLNLQLETGITKGDTLLFGFKMRGVSTVTNKESTLVLTNTRLRPDGASSLNLNAEGYISDEWQQYFVAGQAPADSSPEGGLYVFQIGMAEQVIEIADVFVFDLGTDISVDQLPIMQKTYRGMEEGASWREDALARIDAIRKGDIQINLTDESGQGIRGAEVKVDQQNHDFNFGSIVNADAYEKMDDADKAWYLDTLDQMGNTGGFENDLKMNFITKDGYTEKVDFFLDWFKAHDKKVRGHVLIYGDSWRLPGTQEEQDALMADLQGLKSFTMTYIKDMVNRYEDSIYNWDVVNENMTSTDFTNALGDEAIVDWFQAAYEANPDGKLTLNDFGILSRDVGHQDYHYNLVKSLIDEGAPLTTIGIQGHVSLISPIDVLSILDRFASLGKEIEITEFTFPEKDEALQAQFTKDFMIAIFSHPATTTLMTWGFYEGVMYEPDAAMYRNDHSMKPNGQVWKDMIYNEWWTKESGRTDASGCYDVRAFLGDQKVTVTYGEVTRVMDVHAVNQGLILNMVYKNGQIMTQEEADKSGDQGGSGSPNGSGSSGKDRDKDSDTDIKEELVPQVLNVSKLQELIGQEAIGDAEHRILIKENKIGDGQVGVILDDEVRNLMNQDDYNLVLEIGEVSYVINPKYLGSQGNGALKVIVKKDSDKEDLMVQAVKTQGGELISSPYTFDVSDENEQIIDHFTGYIDRVFEIPESLVDKDSVMGVVLGKDGQITSVPTVIEEKEGKWYATLRSLTNSTYGLMAKKTVEQMVDQTQRIESNHWAYSNIVSLVDDWILPVTSLQRMDDAMTRIDFVKMTLRGLGLYQEMMDDDSELSDFIDVTDETQSQLLGIAKDYGLIQGNEKGVFEPESFITREEAALILWRSKVYMDGTLSAQSDDNNLLADKGVSKWALEGVEGLVKAKVFVGDEVGNLHPQETLTYGEGGSLIIKWLAANNLR